MKISLPQLTNLLSLSSGRQRQECEDFLREFFLLAAEVLESGENVRIKGFGTFKLVEVSARKSVNVSNGEEYEIPMHSKIVFVASKELAAIVNQPFEAFEAVEISDENLDEWRELESGQEESDEDVANERDSEDGANDQAEDNSVGVSDLEIEDETIPENDMSPADDSSSEEESTVIYMTEDASSNENGGGAEPEQEEASGVLYEYDNTSEDEEEKDVNDVDDLEAVESVSDDDNETVSDGYVVEEESVSYTDNLPVRRDFHEHRKKKHYKFAWGFFTGFVACVAVLAIALIIMFYTIDFGSVFAGNQTPEKEEVAVKTESLKEDKIPVTDSKEAKAASAEQKVEEKNDNEPSDATLAPSTKPSDEPVYDTVTTTHYLTTIAKEHYGNYNLWPYIYEENKELLGHPDRIRPGTRVVVPPLSKYGVDPKNPDDIAVAKKKGIEIYSRYKK